MGSVTRLTIGVLAALAVLGTVHAAAVSAAPPTTAPPTTRPAAPPTTAAAVTSTSVAPTTAAPTTLAGRPARRIPSPVDDLKIRPTSLPLRTMGIALAVCIVVLAIAGFVYGKLRSRIPPKAVPTTLPPPATPARASVPSAPPSATALPPPRASTPPPPPTP